MYSRFIKRRQTSSGCVYNVCSISKQYKTVHSRLFKENNGFQKTTLDEVGRIITYEGNN